MDYIFIAIFWMMQIDVDIGSSSVARSVVGLVLGYVTSLVVDLAILIEVCAIFSYNISGQIILWFPCSFHVDLRFVWIKESVIL
jgi:hypothetical protein